MAHDKVGIVDKNRIDFGKRVVEVTLKKAESPIETFHGLAIGGRNRYATRIGERHRCLHSILLMTLKHLCALGHPPNSGWMERDAPVFHLCVDAKPEMFQLGFMPLRRDL